ncbi:pyridoxal phosphate homeostasis protein [Sporobolomyces salmoneus]|uniref:pyridoxal phosphate homeostasis protein n=1 Tax=Sporobolomyces salmoneus TaxID=183962 RepID=UPI0031722AAA
MPIERASEERKEELIKNYERINQRLQETVQTRTSTTASSPRLVAVSKLKPSSDILALYDHGVRHFGENYPQELEAKAKELPDDIEWHYIGTLQSNKCKMLASIPNLYAIETLTSIKSANHLHSTVSSLSPPRSKPLNVFLQINTSGESSKSGLSPLSSSSDSSSSEVLDVAKHIMKECKETLKLKGLMTIGSWDHSHSDSAAENPDFSTLLSTRSELVKRLKEEGVKELGEEEEFELSMGMSNDFEVAIRMGSTNVRVGSSIFGAREPRQK